MSSNEQSSAVALMEFMYDAEHVEEHEESIDVLNDSGFVPEEENNDPIDERNAKVKKTFNKRKLIGPLTPAQARRRESQNRSQRRARRSRTIMNNMMKLDDPSTANCDVFCIITNRDTGHSHYCGSESYVSRFVNDQKLCTYSGGASTKFTNVGTFGLPPNVDDIEGRVEASPKKEDLRGSQRRMLREMAISQGSSLSLSGPSGLSSCSLLKK